MLTCLISIENYNLVGSASMFFRRFKRVCCSSFDGECENFKVARSYFPRDLSSEETHFEDKTPFRRLAFRESAVNRLPAIKNKLLLG